MKRNKQKRLWKVLVPSFCLLVIASIFLSGYGLVQGRYDLGMKAGDIFPESISIASSIFSIQAHLSTPATGYPSIDRPDVTTSLWLTPLPSGTPKSPTPTGTSTPPTPTPTGTSTPPTPPPTGTPPSGG